MAVRAAQATQALRSRNNIQLRPLPTGQVHFSSLTEKRRDLNRFLQRAAPLAALCFGEHEAERFGSACACLAAITMTEVEHGVLLRRRRLLQAGTAGVAATLVPGCTVGVVGGEGTADDDASSQQPAQSGMDNASTGASSGGASSGSFVSQPNTVSGSGAQSGEYSSGNSSSGSTPESSGTPFGSGSVESQPDARSSAPVDASVEDASSACGEDPSVTYVLSLAQNPQLSKVGGAVSVMDNRYSDPVCNEDSFYIVRTAANQFAAFSLGCTHQCCLAQVQGTTVFCGCHGSRFNLMTGAVTGGPARKALPSLPVTTDGTHVCVRVM
jgi:nitrite reductase/ring-hydroxylating ferredoxin subunit